MLILVLQSYTNLSKNTNLLNNYQKMRILYLKKKKNITHIKNKGTN